MSPRRHSQDGPRCVPCVMSTSSSTAAVQQQQPCDLLARRIASNRFVRLKSRRERVTQQPGDTGTGALTYMAMHLSDERASRC